MSFGAELVWIWKNELQSCRGRRVQKAEGRGSAVMLSFGASDILLSWGAQNCGAAIIGSSEKKQILSSALSTPPITNALKSHIVGAELCEVQQLRRDRILRLCFRRTIGAGFVTEKNIILEAMERYSNLLLCDADGIILETARHIPPSENSFRTILPGLLYRLPPEFEGITLEDWLSSPASDTIKNIAGFGRPLLKYAASLDLKAAEALLGAFYAENSSKGFYPQFIGKYLTALPLAPDGVTRVAAASTAGLQTVAPLAENSLEMRRKKIHGIIEKEIKRREKQLADIERLLCESTAENYQRWGSLIVANLWKLTRGESEAQLEGYSVDGEQITEKVPLLPALSPSQCAAAYFAKYKKITQAQQRASVLAESVKAELEDYKEALALCECIMDSEALSMTERELGIIINEAPGRKKKKEEQLPPHRRFEFNGALVVAGLSAKGNRYVTFRFASAGDLWFHAQGVPGSHVILRLTADHSEEELALLKNFCASLAAFYSKGSGTAKCRVDYTLRKFVSPIRGGEANVTYREFSTIMAEPESWKNFKELS